MAVVINEFEVVAEPQTANQSPEAPTSAEAAPPSAPALREIERLLRQQLERLARVKAH